MSTFWVPILAQSPTWTVSPRVHVCEPGLAPSQKGFQIPHLDPGTSLRVWISAWPARVTPRTGTHIRRNAHFALRSPRHLGTRWPARVTFVHHLGCVHMILSHLGTTCVPHLVHNILVPPFRWVFGPFVPCAKWVFCTRGRSVTYFVPFVAPFVDISSRVGSHVAIWCTISWYLPSGGYLGHLGTHLGCAIWVHIPRGAFGRNKHFLQKLTNLGIAVNPRICAMCHLRLH